MFSLSFLGLTLVVILSLPITTLQRHVKVWRSKAILTFDYEWLKEELLVEEKFKTKLHGKITHEAVL